MSACSDVEASARSVFIRQGTCRHVRRVSGKWRRIPSVAPHLDGFEESEANHLQSTFLELGDLCVRAGIEDSVGENAVRLQVVEGNDHPAARGGRRGGRH